MSDHDSTYMRICRNLAIGQGAASVFCFAVLHSIPYFSLALTIFFVLGMVGLKVKGNALAAAKEAPALEAHSRWVDEKCTPKNEYDCRLFDAIALERRMFEAGVITLDEISLCDEADCVNCGPERRRRREVERIRLRVERESAVKVADNIKLDEMSERDRRLVEKYQLTELERMARGARGQSCQTCRAGTLFETHCPTCLLAELNRAKSESAARREAKQQQQIEQKARAFERNRVHTLNGLTFKRPSVVPEGATPNINITDDVTEIVWTWFTNEGQKVHYRQPIVADTYAVNTAHGAVDSWVAVFDATSGEHLGDYRRNEWSTPEAKNPQPRIYLRDAKRTPSNCDHENTWCWMCAVQAEPEVRTDAFLDAGRHYVPPTSSSRVCPGCGERKNPEMNGCLACVTTINEIREGHGLYNEPKWWGES